MAVNSDDFRHRSRSRSRSRQQLRRPEQPTASSSLAPTFGPASSTPRYFMIRNAAECTLSNLPFRRRDRWPTGPGFRVQAQAQAYDDAVSLSSALLDAIHFRPQWSGLLVDYLSRFLEFYLVSHAENRVPNSFVFPPFPQDHLFLYQTPGITNDPGTWFLRGMARRRWYRLDFNPHGGMAWRDVHAPPEGLARDFHTYYRR